MRAGGIVDSRIQIRIAVAFDTKGERIVAIEEARRLRDELTGLLDGESGVVFVPFMQPMNEDVLNYPHTVTCSGTLKINRVIDGERV
jgi:ribosomal protein S2